MFWRIRCCIEKIINFVEINFHLQHRDMTQDILAYIAEQFAIEGEVVAIEALGEGFINDTYVVTTAGDAPNYILQRKTTLYSPMCQA